MTNFDYIIVIFASFIGSLGSGFFGYFQSKEPFNFHKFAPSIWSAILSAMLFAAYYQKTTDIGTLNFIIAFLGGAGVDSLTKRAQSQPVVIPSNTVDTAYISSLEAKIKELTIKGTE